LKEEKTFDVFENEEVEKKIKYITSNWLDEQKDIEK